ncbi:NAD(P)H-hydrate dehydratase [Alkalicoccobacillus porphyridii]|nr:NAD(P)H-hydrate dehydratase [Alkalicoccobacillus porphyridii]
MLEQHQVSEWLPYREQDKDTNKRDYGQVLLIGGSRGMGGAILMAAEAAMMSGAGLTTVATDENHFSALHTRLPEAMAVPLEDVKEIRHQIKKNTVIAMGPGLGLDEKARDVFRLVLKEVEQHQTLLLDADALTLLSEEKVDLPQMTILTPHAGEWQRLTGLKPEEQSENENRKWANKLGALVVLKGDQTRIYTPEASYLNIKGTPAMATGGMGDCLTGCIAGICAQNEDVLEGVLAAVFLHSYIGCSLAQTRHVVRPTEIAQSLPVYMKQLSTLSK